MSVFQDHKDPQCASTWSPFLTGWITACGAPSRPRLQAWVQAGVTDVITLLRADEFGFPFGSACESLGLAWHHIPLSGKLLSAPTDAQSIESLGVLFAHFRTQNTPLKLVVHCAAGLHRTGVALYILLRLSGTTPSDTLTQIQSIRPITAHELSRTPKRGPSLATQAESLFQSLSTPP